MIIFGKIFQSLRLLTQLFHQIYPTSLQLRLTIETMALNRVVVHYQKMALHMLIMSSRSMAIMMLVNITNQIIASIIACRTTGSLHHSTIDSLQHQASVHGKEQATVNPAETITTVDKPQQITDMASNRATIAVLHTRNMATVTTATTPTTSSQAITATILANTCEINYTILIKNYSLLEKTD